jgi:ADP-heptose:LPS heptosyltransferase
LIHEGRGEKPDVDSGIRDKPWIAIHPAGGVNPGMTLLSKRWPAARFAALAERLIEERDARILVLGGPEDRAVAKVVLDALPPRHRSAALDLSGQLSLGATAAAIQRCALFIGNDTGVSHLACGVGTPALMIFGPTNPKRYGPLPGAGLAVSPLPSRDKIPDRNAPLSSSTASNAIKLITPDQVWSAALTLLAPTTE